jgi:CRISP-associated protein Cas1
MYWVLGKPARLSYRAGVMVLEREHGASERIGLGALGSIIISGAHYIDATLLRAASERGCQVLLLDRRARAGVWLSSTMRHGVALRAAQHKCHSEPALRLELVRALLQAKFSAQSKLISSHAIQPSPNLQEATLHTLRAASAKLNLAVNLASLRGIEGNAAVQYWRWFGAVVPAPFAFTQRARRPPPDPVNACLSLAYVMSQGATLAALHASGFDPALGFLHDIYPGRDSLLFDLIEPMRARADAFVLSLLPELTPEHFRTEAGRGCFLSQSGQRIFFSAWAYASQNWARLAAEDTLPERAISIDQAARLVTQQLRNDCLRLGAPSWAAEELHTQSAELPEGASEQGDFCAIGDGDV